MEALVYIYNDVISVMEFYKFIGLLKDESEEEE